MYCVNVPNGIRSVAGVSRMAAAANKQWSGAVVVVVVVTSA